MNMLYLFIYIPANTINYYYLVVEGYNQMWTICAQ